MLLVGKRVSKRVVPLGCLCVAAASLLPGTQVQAEEVMVMTFNILQGGNSANEVGSTSPLFQQPRHDEIVAAILESGAGIVAIQEDNGGNAILARLQAADASWRRRGSIYARYTIEAVSPQITSSAVSRVWINDSQSVVIHNAHWWPGQGYGPFVAQTRLVNTGSVDEAYVQANSGVYGTPNRNPNDSLSLVQGALNLGEPVFVVGDFNEPSHLDWTENYASNGGADRMVSNPDPDNPLNLAVEWAGSKQLADAGLRDAYRVIFPDEIANPGNTWTPPYDNNTPGRRDYDDQVLDRIDRIEYAGYGVTATAAAVMGENPNATEHGGMSELTPEMIFSGPWPSDHRAVVATFDIPDTALVIGDLNFDGEVTLADWSDVFRPNQGGDFEEMHRYDTYGLGDLDGDLDNDNDDLDQFRSLFDAIHGEGELDAFIHADLNGDGFIGIGDLDIILASWGDAVPAGSAGDVDMDGQVDQADLDLVIDRWGSGSLAGVTVPEPASAMGLGGMMLICMRRGVQ